MSIDLNEIETLMKLMNTHKIDSVIVDGLTLTKSKHSLEKIRDYNKEVENDLKKATRQIYEIDDPNDMGILDVPISLLSRSVKE